MNLGEKRCVPCEEGGKPLDRPHAEQLMEELHPSWEFDAEGKKIRRAFQFSTFVKAMAFVDRLADLAESEGHHPDIHISYSTVVIELWTHTVGGLSENDFILAAKIDGIT